MNIETFLKSKETYQKVLDTLRTYADIEDESKGFVAGGSVSNILFSLIHGGNAVVNDIDVYWQVKEDVKLKEEQWYPAVYVNEDGLEMVDDAYGRVFVSDSGSRMRVVKHSRKGIFNNIEYLYEERKRYLGSKSSAIASAVWQILGRNALDGRDVIIKKSYYQGAVNHGIPDPERQYNKSDIL